MQSWISKNTSVATSTGDITALETRVDSLETEDVKQNTNNPGIVFDITNTDAPVEGGINWNSTDGTLQVGMPGGDVTLQIGQELFIRAKNVESTTISNGSAVRIIGAASARPEVVLVNNLEEIADHTIAVATEDVHNGGNGYFTTFGLVNGINTNHLVEGELVYLNSTDGTLVSTEPDHPSMIVVIGTCLRKSLTEGVLFVNIDAKRYIRGYKLTGEPTGFVKPDCTHVSYNSTTGKITVTGTAPSDVEAYYQNTRLIELINNWASPALIDTFATPSGLYYLSYDGTDYVWDDTLWDLDELQIAWVYYNTSNQFVLCGHETHGLMQWQAHKEFHLTIGTYLRTGADISGITLNSNTAAQRRPITAETTISDEDCNTILPVDTGSNYTQMYLDASANSVFVENAADIVPLSTANPYWNSNVVGAYAQTLLTANQYMNIWEIAIPVGSDVKSQKYRYVYVQGQNAGTLATIDAETSASINLGILNEITPEYCFINRITIRYISNNWIVTKVLKLTGTKYSQIAVSGGYLSAISTDGNTVTGNGTASSPLMTNNIVVKANADSATVSNVGATRYINTANSSSVETVMQTGASTYAWVVIKTNTW